MKCDYCGKEIDGCVANEFDGSGKNLFFHISCSVKQREVF